MLSPSDYNSAVPQFTNGNYAANPINPLYIEEPGSTDYNRGVEPLQTLPAQWWNWFANQFTLRFNKLNIYVKNIFNELTQLLSLMNITPDGTEVSPTISQLKGAFQTEYPKYLALIMYPVGSLYWTGKAPDDGGDPNTLFGGTWVQIKGKFIFAKGDSDTLNDTGGSKTVTLTTEQIPSHNHSFTPSGTVSSHTHSVGAHAHGLNSHTHTLSHTHTINPGNTANQGTKTDAGIRISGSTGGMSTNSTGSFLNRVTGGKFAIVGATTSQGTASATGNCSATFEEGYGDYGNSAYPDNTWRSARSKLTINVAHTHTLPALYIYGNTGSASTTTTSQATGNTDNSSAFNSGSTQPTFTGTAGTTGNTGGGQAHDNMPPYVVKYCWERTA